VVTEARPAPRSRRRGAVAVPRDRLDYLDQASFLSLRATGREQVMQMVWLYEHPVDLDGVRRFHQTFGYGHFGRRIERSALPFGRHRWVSAQGPAAPLDIVAEPRPRTEMSDWLDERTQLPVDPELGPGWHMGVLPMTDGSTAISLVVSHCLGDGTAGLQRVVESVHGRKPDLGYSPPRSRPRLRAALEDARGTLADLPDVGRALAGAARLLRDQRRERRASAHVDVAPRRPSARTAASGDEVVVIPAINVVIDIAEWDARAVALHGNAYTLLGAFGAQLGARMGRRNSSTGEVMLMIALSERTAEDTRAHAMTFFNVHVDPSTVTEDLSSARAAIKAGVEKQRAAPDEKFGLLALSPFTPKRAVRSAGGLAFGFDDLPVSCSNMGDLDSFAGMVDGSPAEYIFLRGVDQNVARADIEASDGQLVLVAGRIAGKLSVSMVGYQNGVENSKDRLRELAAQVLADFGVTGEIF
jgi:hypothetical protein